MPTEQPNVFAAMRAYAGRGDRSPPPVFIGRDDELRQLRDVVERVAEDALGSHPLGLVQVVQGPPGAGKTALCIELERRINRLDAATRKAVAINLSSRVLDSDPVDLAARIAPHVPLNVNNVSRHLPRLDAIKQAAKDVASFSYAMWKNTVTRELVNNALGLNKESTLADCLDAYRRLWDDVVIVLTMDEMQNAPVSKRAKQNLEEIHLGRHDARLLLIAFGLQNSKDVLATKHGLSRLDDEAVVNLGSLHCGEGMDVIEATFDHLGITWENAELRTHLRRAGFDASTWNAWAADVRAAIESESCDFPHHLTNGMRSVCRELLRDWQSVSPPSADDLKARIMAGSRASRIRYYRARLAPVSRHTLAIAAALVAQVRSGGVDLDEGQALKALATTDNSGYEVGAKAARQAFEMAFERGIFEAGASEGTLRVGIPSMQRYLVDEFDQAVARGSEAALALEEALRLTPSKT